jgi:peptidoglycan/xylan/chitin deacetylase (PgdA/CDA1 family)
MVVRSVIRRRVVRTAAAVAVFCLIGACGGSATAVGGVAGTAPRAAPGASTASSTGAAPGAPGGATPGTATGPDSARRQQQPQAARPLTPAQRALIPKFPDRPAPQPVIGQRPVIGPAGPSVGWYLSVPTTQPVAFITIDDGWVKNPQAVPLLQAAHVPVTLFLEINAIRSDVPYFTALQQAGAVIEDHTITHMELKGKPYEVQKHEICASADQLGSWYGRRPVLFRPPFGDKDGTTLRAAHDCGMKAAFYWKEATNGGTVYFQEGRTIRAGDIVLMHFRPRFVDDFLAVLQAIHRAGLTPALLEDYVA